MAERTLRLAVVITSEHIGQRHNPGSASRHGLHAARHSFFLMPHPTQPLRIGRLRVNMRQTATGTEPKNAAA